MNLDMGFFSVWLRRWAIVGWAFCMVACAHEGVGLDPNPLPGIELERTTRLLELREALAHKNQVYEAERGDRLRRNTNKRQMGGLEDEYANRDRRAQAQIERELARRYQEGETRAYFPGIEALVPGAVPPPVEAVP